MEAYSCITVSIPCVVFYLLLYITLYCELKNSVLKYLYNVIISCNDPFLTHSSKLLMWGFSPSCPSVSSGV